MKISYKPFFEYIEKRNVKKYSLVKEAGVSNDVIRHISENKPITMNALLKLCEALDCQLGDIVVFEKIKKKSLKNI